MSDHVQERPDAGPQQQDTASWVGPRLLWFGVLGGALAWVVHLLVAWLFVELTCTEGRQQVQGVSLQTIAWLATAVPAVIAAAAWALAWRAARVLRRAERDVPAGVPPRRITRARFMAQVGTWIDGLSLLMIFFGGAAVLTVPACAR